MVRGTCQGVIGLSQALKYCCKVFSCRIQYGCMKESGRISWGRRGVLAKPNIQTDVVVIAPGRYKGGLLAVGSHDFKAQQSAVKIERRL